MSQRFYLHGKFLQFGILCNRLNVIYSQTCEEVHDDDGHHDHEYDEEEGSVTHKLIILSVLE